MANAAAESADPKLQALAAKLGVPVEALVNPGPDIMAKLQAAGIKASFLPEALANPFAAYLAANAAQPSAVTQQAAAAVKKLAGAGVGHAEKVAGKVAPDPVPALGAAAKQNQL